MFDSISVSAPRRPNVHHHEHRAPTDKSVELLREMEAAAEKRVLYSARLESNEFRCVWRVVTDDYHMTHRAICQFDLNGKAHTVEVELPAGASRAAFADKVLKEVQREVAMQITLPLFMDATTRKAIQSQ